MACIGTLVLIYSSARHFRVIVADPVVLVDRVRCNRVQQILRRILQEGFEEASMPTSHSGYLTEDDAHYA